MTYLDISAGSIADQLNRILPDTIIRAQQILGMPIDETGDVTRYNSNLIAAVGHPAILYVIGGFRNGNMPNELFAKEQLQPCTATVTEAAMHLIRTLRTHLRDYQISLSYVHQNDQERHLQLGLAVELQLARLAQGLVLAK